MSLARTRLFFIEELRLSKLHRQQKAVKQRVEVINLPLIRGRWNYTLIYTTIRIGIGGALNTRES